MEVTSQYERNIQKWEKINGINATQQAKLKCKLNVFLNVQVFKPQALDCYYFDQSHIYIVNNLVLKCCKRRSSEEEHLLSDLLSFMPAAGVLSHLYKKTLQCSEQTAEQQKNLIQHGFSVKE